jgi:hypothetical protein
VSGQELENFAVSGRFWVFWSEPLGLETWAGSRCRDLGAFGFRFGFWSKGQGVRVKGLRFRG